ncbi:phage holin, LLH family [Halobacillus litoralis]|uniref:phage holin, LLH family n=1 Tax=Halobacillus litoralis TaxID=45668 RepID=UPI001CD71F36|nr:phage holin, LLH family [Halobacillus litoralis]MCA1021669.1 hypothetical protein [Halobacillus litoralis]
MDILIAIGVSVAAVLVMLYVVPFLQDKGVFRNGLATQKQMLRLADVLVKSSDFKDKDLYSKILTAANHAVAYVEQVSKDTELPNEHKYDMAYDVVQDILTVAEIRMTDEVQEIIDITIEVAVNSLPKQPMMLHM